MGEALLAGGHFMQGAAGGRGLLMGTQHPRRSAPRGAACLAAGHDAEAHDGDSDPGDDLQALGGSAAQASPARRRAAQLFVGRAGTQGAPCGQRANNRRLQAAPRGTRAAAAALVSTVSTTSTLMTSVSPYSVKVSTPVSTKVVCDEKMRSPQPCVACRPTSTTTWPHLP